MKQDYFLAVQHFQRTFNHPAPDKVSLLTPERTLQRSSYTVEEIVELLHASVGGNPSEFKELMNGLNVAIEKATEKQLNEGPFANDTEQERITRMYDALVDSLYFVIGSFVELGIDPQEGFNIVHRANMGKLGPDGKPIIRESDNKIMKPENWERDYAPEKFLRNLVERKIKEV